MRKFALQCNARYPSRLTSTNLRKSIACMAQVLSLKEHEMESMATFFGHDISVLRQFYRLPLDVMQLARVSKTFLAAEQGRISDYARKGLTDISLDPNEEAEEAAAGSSDSDSDMDEQSPEDPRPMAAEQNTLVTEIDHQNIQLIKKRRAGMSRKQWTAEEKEAVRSHFASYIMHKKLPGKRAIEDFLKQTNLDRKWTNVKDHIRNDYLQ